MLVWSRSLTKSFKCPLVFPTNFLFFLRSEVILNVKGLTNFLWSLPLDHVRYSLACKVQQALDVQRQELKKEKGKTDQDEIEERGLIDLDEIGVPRLEIFVGGLLIGIRSLNVLFAVLDYLGQDLACDVGKRDAAICAIVLDHMLDRLRFQRHCLVHLERLAVRTLQGDLPRRRHA
ncbi:hypothetical protein CR513_50258, partial [Mucuna pruriens]